MTPATTTTNVKIRIPIWDVTWASMWLDENGVNNDRIDTGYDPSLTGSTRRYVMIGTAITIGILGYYINSCVHNRKLAAKCKI